MIGTQPGRYYNFIMCWWEFYDRRGQQVATITDEAISRTPERRMGWHL